jgi:hypothetical protein
MTANVAGTSSDLVDRSGYDYRLVSASAARDAGVDPGRAAATNYNLRPFSHYVHPLRSEPRPRDEVLDVGAYEYSP